MSDPTEPRLRVLAATRLLDSPPEPSYDRLTSLTARVLRTPVALVTLVDDQRQFFKSAHGLREPWASRRQTPLSYSFCQHVVRSRSSLVVRDAREDPGLRDNPAIAELGAIAYAGVPLVVGGEAVGALCVVDGRPRDWTDDDVQALSDLAAAVVSEVELGLALRVAREQRAVMQTILESMGDAVLAIDPQGTFLVANAAARRAFTVGAKVGQKLPDDWAALHRSFRPDGSPLPSSDGALARGLRGLQTDGLEFTLHPPGADALTWVEASGRPVRDDEGRLIAAVGVYRDVTERKRRFDLYATLAANIPRAAVLLFDAELRCLGVEGPLARGRGVDPRALLGRPALELVGASLAASDRERLEGAWRRALAGHAVALDIAHDDHTVAVQVAPVRDALGRVTAGIALAQDVTEHRRNEAALRERQLIYQAIVQNLPNGAVFVLDEGYRYLSADGPALASFLGRTPVPPEGFVGRTVAEVVDRAHLPPLLAAYAEAFRGKRQRLELRSGESLFEISAEPIAEVGAARASRIVVFCYDVTARARAHAGNVALLQEIHHRVKNNLQMIASLLNLQARRVADEGARATLLDTRARVRSIALLHESLYQAADFGRVDMRDYLEKLVDSLRRAHAGGEASARLATSLEPTFLPVTAAVPCGLIVNELVTNAFKHAFVARESDEGNEVRVSLRRDGADVVLSVTDNGRGFAARAPDETDTLGLTLVRDLSAQLGGGVDFTRERGSLSVVRFPASQPSEGAP